MAQRYETYKDSGVQWLGEIPGHWGCVALKRICEMKSGNNITALDILDEGEYPVYGANGLRGYYNQYNKEGNYILVGRQGALAGNVHLVDGKFWATDHAIVTTITSDKIYTDYLALSLDAMNLNQYAFDTAAQPGLAVSKIIALSSPIPPLSEQRVIADAVTRGLNPNVTMKQTNIPWLPEVPEYWDMSKVSSHFMQRNEKVSDKDYPALSVSKQGVTPQLDNVALSNAEGASRKLVKVGDYAVNSRSDRKGSCGISKYEGSVSLITIVLEPFDIDGEYVHYLFRSNPWVEEFYRNGRGIVADLWTTNFQMMKGMYLPVPPLEEQKQIVAYITDKTSKIDKLIASINKEIEGIKEYKQRLISDVVTGQIKVC